MKTKVLFFLLILFTTAEAQKALTIEDVVNIALKNNYNILVAHNDAEIAKVNNTLGNAGMLPTVQINGGGGYANNHAYQKSGTTGIETHYPNQNATTVSANAELNWILFDGGKMFVTKNKLNEIQSLGEIQFQAKVMETLYNVIGAYYNVVQQKQQLKSFNEVINYNRERVKIAETGYNAGSLIKTDLLQSKIDLNVATENAINQQYVIEAAKKNLNNLLAQPENTAFEVTDTIPLTYTPNKAELMQKLNSSNTSILAFQKQMLIAQLTMKETQRGYSPLVNLKGGYYLSKTVNSQGSTLATSSYGPGVSGTIAIPLYNAGETKRKIANAKLEMQSAEYNLNNTKLQVNTELQNTLTDFENQQRLLKIEKENNSLAKENLEISLYRLRLGQTTALEVHLAQENYVQSCTRLTSFEYNLKLAETKLKQLVAGL